ncbi:MAG: tetratricopeptide repeat protein [Bacteroidota bacterium]
MIQKRKQDSLYKRDNYFNKIFLVLGVLIIVSSCSTHKDKLINRGYHNTTTVYNVLYNGNVSLEKAEEIIVDNFEDDFRTILPVSPFEVGMKAMRAKSHLENADEKAAKAIQKHSMNIGGSEKNKYMDASYLLLGKARYYQSKFLPALEAFNYIKLNFRGGEAYYESLLWSAKTQIELGNFALAVSEIEDMLDNQNMPKEFKPELYAHYSDALLQQKKYPGSIKQMKMAVELEKDVRVKTRYAYILGQIYRLDGRKSQSTDAFEDVIEFGSPYKYVLHAKLDKAENFDIDQNDLKLYVEALEDMLDEKKNQNDLEKIYYQIGSIYFKDQYYEEAEENLKKSIAEAKGKKYEKGVAFEQLGNVYFDQAKYKYAASYYDSTLAVMSKSYINYKDVSRKRKQLNNVIKFITIAEENDSILKLSAMSDQERIDFFENHIVWLKEEEARKIAEAEEAAKLALENASSTTSSYSGGSRSSFYMYNPVTLEYGKSEFNKRWGDRPLQDQWRILSKPVNTLVSKIEGEEGEQETDEEIPVEEGEEKEFVNPLYTVEYYTKQIPTSQDTLDVMKADRDFAYYALGLIYNEQFGKYELSATTLETLLGYKPDKDLKLPVYYYLYKNYHRLGYVNKEKEYKDIILNSYPDSRYAEMILNPNEVNTESEKERVDLLYEDVLKNLDKRDFRAVIVSSDELISNFPANELIPKVELIKAVAIGKLGKSREFEEALEYVMYNFPNDEVSERAKKYLGELNKENKYQFDLGKKDSPRIVILADKEVDFSELENSIAKIVWQKRLKTERSNFSYEKDVFVIYNFQSWEVAEDFKREFLPNSLINSKLSTKNIKAFIISKYNFNILQRKKNEDVYFKSIENK